MKTTLKLITAIFATCLIMQVSAQDTTTYLTLSKACQLGINNNLILANASLETQKSAYGLKEVKSKLYPQLEGYSDFNYYYAIPKMMMPGEFFGTTGEIPVEIGTKYDWSSGFKASVYLFNLSYYTSIKIANEMQTSNELSLEQKKEGFIYQVSQVYYLCLSTDAQIEYLKLLLMR
jgi:outer membrane protein